jgi:pyruvate dehydrogenase E1 component alpha subunit
VTDVTNVQSPPASTDPWAEVLTILQPDGQLVTDGWVPEELTGESLGQLHGLMVRHRMLDRALLMLAAAGRIGPYVGGVGFEASVFGAGWTLGLQDWVFPAPGCAGIALLRGMTLDDYLAQVFANTLDPGQGRRLPGLIAAPAQQVASTSHDGAHHLLHAVGAARGMRVRESNGVALAFTTGRADACNEFLVACQLAHRESLPLVLFALRDIAVRPGPAGQITRRGQSAGMRTVRIDGHDVLAVYAVTRDAVAAARRGEGPTLIEATVSRPDPQPTHADADLPEPFLSRDPLRRLAVFARTKGTRRGLDNDSTTAVRAEWRAVMDDLIALAAVQDAPPLATMTHDVYAPTTASGMTEQER